MVIVGTADASVCDGADLHEAVKAAIKKAKICKKPIAGYDKEKSELM